MNAGPTIRGWPGCSGLAPLTQTLRRPFFSRRVVSVAVDTADSVWMVLLSTAIGSVLSSAEEGPAVRQKPTDAP